MAAAVGSSLKRSMGACRRCSLPLQLHRLLAFRYQPLSSLPDDTSHAHSSAAQKNLTFLIQTQSHESLVRQAMGQLLQDCPFVPCRSALWTVDAVRDVLRAVPRLFFQSPRSVGRQEGFRRRAPLKQRDLRQEAEDSRNGRRPHGPAAYQDPLVVERGVDRALEFFSWVERECGFVHVEATCREMAYVLVKGNGLKKLWQFLREMAGRGGDLVTTATMTCVIKFLGEEGLVKEALATFYRMKQFHCKPDVIAFNVIISSLCRVGYFKKARFLLDQMEMPGSRCPPDAFTYTILIGFYCKRSLQTGCRKAIRRRLWEANHMFRHMLLKGFVPDVVTYNCLIDGLCKTYRIGRALELFKDMLIKGCTPNRVTYNSFIRYYSAVNEIDKAVEMFHNMRLQNHGIPTSSSYTPIIHALCESRRPVEARDYLVEMVEGGSIPRDYTFKLVCDTLSLMGVPNLPEDLRQKIEHGIKNRYLQLMKVKPIMARKDRVIYAEV
ncbi:hypothetical protein ACLOJK_004245 [Asimina triloba]